MRYRIMTTKSGGGFSGQGLTTLYSNDKAFQSLASSQRCPPRCDMAHENVEGQELLIDVPPASSASEACSVIYGAVFHSAVLQASMWLKIVWYESNRVFLIWILHRRHFQYRCLYTLRRVRR